MKSIESRLSRLEQVAPFPNYQFLAVADTPDEGQEELLKSMKTR